jgi:hypothetical protein
LKTLVTSSTQSSKKKQELHAFKNRRDDSELNIALARITTAFLVLYISRNLQIHAAPAPIELIKPEKPAADRRSAYRTAAAIENCKGRNSTT